MSLEIKGKSCPICHAYLFEEDEIVYCPICGAPHHKDCFLTIGHCGLEDFHGTEKQYDRTKDKDTSQSEHEENKQNSGLKSVLCQRCRKEYDAQEKACPYCGLPNIAFGHNIIMLDPLGGVPADYKFDGGITAKQMTRFVGASTMRIIPKFARLFSGEKAFFDIWAFLFPSAHFAFRKMRKAAIIAFVIQIVASILTLPFVNFVSSQITEETSSYFELIDTVSSKLNEAGVPVLVLYGLGLALALILRFVCAFGSTKFYYNHCINTIKDIEENSEDKDQDYLKKGGVSIFSFLLFLLAAEYLPRIIFMFL